MEFSKEEHEKQVAKLKEQTKKLKGGLEAKSEKLRFCAEQALSLQTVNKDLQRQCDHLSAENDVFRQTLAAQAQ